MELLFWLVVGVGLIVGIGLIVGLVWMSLQAFRETPKTALVYSVCIAVLYLGFIALGGSWLNATAPAIFLGILLGMWAMDWLGVKEDD